MIHRRIDNCSVALSPEDPDDLLALRRIIASGDRVVSDTTRVVKMDREYARPDSGRRVRIRLALDVERASLDYRLDRLRIRGVIAEANSEHVSRGSHHSLVVGLGDRLTLTKKAWTALHRLLLKRGAGAGFVLVAVDTDGCGIGRLKGTHLHTVPEIRSSYSGKRYRSSFRIEVFFGEIERALESLASKGDAIVIFGPGQTKNKLANYFHKSSLAASHGISVADGVDTGGEDGLHTFTKSDTMRKMMAESKLARVLSILDEIMAAAGRGKSRFTMGLNETQEACRSGAIGSLIFSERILQEADEDAVIELLNRAQSAGANVYGVDSSTDIGLRVDGLGGIVSLLRFAMR